MPDIKRVPDPVWDGVQDSSKYKTIVIIARRYMNGN